MTFHDPHVDDRLDDWLDERLPAAERRAVDRHLAGCAECRGLRDALVAGRRTLRADLADEAPPGGLEARIRAALDREDGVSASARGPRLAPVPAAGRRAGYGRRWLLPLAAGLALAVLAGWWLVQPRAAGGDAVDAAFGQLASLAESDLEPALRVADAGELERRWQRARLDFPVRVIDLSAMDIELVGGDATTLAGTPAARSVYRGAGGVVICWMFPAAPSRLSAADEIRTHGGLEFRVYRRGERTLVVWREGEVLCALAGRGDAETVIGLAFAKAATPGAAARSTG